MRTIFIAIVLIIPIFGIRCSKDVYKKNKNDQILINQPNSLILDTSSCYYKYIKEYITSDPDPKNSYLLAVYYSDDEYVKTKIAAFKPAEALDFNFRVPSCYFMLFGKTVFILNGMDYISLPDNEYIKKINEQLINERHFERLPPAWEIVYDWDTCYYRETNLSLIPVATESQKKRVKFVKPEK